MGVFDGDYTIRAVGDRGAGHDGHGFLIRDAASGGLAGGDFSDDFQLGRGFCDIGAADGVAVHQAFVEGGIVAIGEDVLGEDVAVGLIEGELDDARGDRRGVDDCDRLGDGDKIGHIGLGHVPPPNKRRGRVVILRYSEGSGAERLTRQILRSTSG